MNPVETAVYQAIIAALEEIERGGEKVAASTLALHLARLVALSGRLVVKEGAR